LTLADVCDLVHALILERVEGDARAQYVAAGVASVFGADGMEEYAPERARELLEERLTSDGSVRPANVSEDEWELRLALGVGTGG
jgi:hypothetical protein